MKTVLFITAVAGHGGPIASLLDVLPAFAGYRRVCVGPWPERVRGYLDGGLAEAVYETERARARQIPGVVRILRRAIRRERPDVIFANGMTEAALAAFALTAMGSLGSTPVVVWVHNSEVPAITLHTRGFIARKDFRWYAVSRFSADLARDAGFSDQVEVIPNPIGENVVAPARTPGGERVRVGFLGSEQPIKGFDYLAAVMDRTRHLPIAWRLYLRHREHPGWAWVNPLLGDPGLDIRVEGRVFPVSQAYGALDAVFVPSRMESFCRVVAEAMANELPVVASDLPPIRDLLGGGQAGILCPAGDIEAYARGLETIVTDRAFATALGCAGGTRIAPYAMEQVRRTWVDRVVAAHG